MPVDPIEIEKQMEALLGGHNSAQMVSSGALAYGGVDCDSEAGGEACEQFLARVEEMSVFLKLEPSCRKYRNEFSINYQQLLSSEARCYRPDVLRGALSVTRVTSIYVNGMRHTFSSSVLELGMELKCAWLIFADVLQRCSTGHLEQSQILNSELPNALLFLDAAWASFEAAYIGQLMQIEHAARTPLINAIAATKSVMINADECSAAMLAISQLNKLANFEGKGRSDLQAKTLLCAHSWLMEHGMLGHRAAGSFHRGAKAMLQLVAGNLRDSFCKLQGYLQTLEQCILEVDPCLANNDKLASYLMTLEECWDIGDRYLASDCTFKCFLQLASKLETFRRTSGALAEMVSSCEAELFLVVPRLVLLSTTSCGGRRILEEEMQTTILEGLLPHSEASQLCTVFAKASDLLSSWLLAVRPRATPKKLQAYLARKESKAMTRAFVQAVVAGPGGGGRCARAVAEAHLADVGESLGAVHVSRRVRTSEKILAGTDVHILEEIEGVFEAMLRELECRSMRLQRHSAKEWNSMAALLVKSMQGVSTPPVP